MLRLFEERKEITVAKLREENEARETRMPSVSEAANLLVDSYCDGTEIIIDHLEKYKMNSIALNTLTT